LFADFLPLALKPKADMNPLVATLFLLYAAPAWAGDGHHGMTGGIFIPLCVASVVGSLLATYKWRPARFPRTAVLAGIVVAALSGVWVLVAQSMPFTSHMLAQMVLMDLAAPLLAVTLASVRGYTTALPSLVSAHSISSRLFATGMFHAMIMWAWHVPAIYIAASHAPVMHALMQVSFLVAGVAFWNAIIGARGAKPGLALFWLFMMVMHTGLLGALLTFAPTPLYGFALEDQQLGGLMMWVAGTSIYALAGMFVAARWLAALERNSPHERPA